MVAEKENPESAEAVALFEYRKERFIELGFSFRLALRLARDGADWHEAERLLAAGCPPATAARLLA